MPFDISGNINAINGIIFPLKIYKVYVQSLKLDY